MGLFDIFATEITNPAMPGEPGYGWTYYTDGTAIDPEGAYYKNEQLIWTPAASANTIARAASGDKTALDTLSDVLKMAPQIAAGISAFQLSQINVQRAKYGMPPLSSAYNPGVNVGLSSHTMMFLGIGAIALFALSRNR